MVDPAVTQDLRQMRFPLRRGISVSLPVDILAETEDDVFINTDTKFFRLQKSAFRAANAKPTPEDIVWEIQDFYDLSDALRDGRYNCPEKEDRDHLKESEAMIIQTYRVPVRYTYADRDWKCGSSCYFAATQLEKLSDREQSLCPPQKPAPESRK